MTDFKKCWEILKMKMMYDLASVEKLVETYNYDCVTGRTEPTEIQSEVIYVYECIIEEMGKIEKQNISKPAKIIGQPERKSV